MTLLPANIVRTAAGALVVVACVCGNPARALGFVPFDGLNPVGSLLLLIASLAVGFDLASMALEIAWAKIAPVGRVEAPARRRPA